MRRGFTMIELIFIIVIIGILAAVAIPKLAANRDDAEISNILINLAVCIENTGAYTTSKANPTIEGFNAIQSCSNIKADPHDSFELVYDPTDKTLTVTEGTGTDAVAQVAQARGIKMVTTHNFRGERVD